MHHFFTRACLGVAATLVVATSAESQIMRRPTAARVPSWAGVSVGFAQGYSVQDGSTSSDWDFGSGLEYAARLERPLASGISVGIQGVYAKMPLTYSSPTLSEDATARVTQVMGVLHYGRGYSFHPIYELAVGMIGFSDFRTEAGDTRLSNSTDWDPKFSIAYGFGFGLSSRASVEILQEFGTALHQRDGLAGSSSSFPRIYVTRLGGKLAF